MATPIKPTPILTGADSRQFAKAMENVQKITPEFKEITYSVDEVFDECYDILSKHYNCNVKNLL